MGKKCKKRKGCTSAVTLKIPAVYEVKCKDSSFGGMFPGCECEPYDEGKLDDILDLLEEMQKKIEELEEKIENCDCCDCGETPGGEVTIHLSETSRTLALPDGAFQLQAIVGPADLQDKSVTWISSDPTIATVDQDGNVTAVGVGTATITATTNVGGKSASCAVTVSDESTPWLDGLIHHYMLTDTIDRIQGANLTKSDNIELSISGATGFQEEAENISVALNLREPCTMIAWVYHTSEDAQHEAILATTTPTASFRVYGAFLGLRQPSAREVYTYYRSGDAAASGQFYSRPNLNQWHMVGITMDGSTSSVFVDDLPFQAGQNAGAENFNDYPVLCIGGVPHFPGSPFKGYIKNVQIYNRAITPSEAAQLYHSTINVIDTLQ